MKTFAKISNDAIKRKFNNVVSFVKNILFSHRRVDINHFIQQALMIEKFSKLLSMGMYFMELYLQKVSLGMLGRRDNA